MGSTVSTGRVTCADCGSIVEGRFCSNCGADLSRQRHGLVRRTAADVRQLAVTLLRMLLAPVRTTLALSRDPSYRRHLSFVAISVALSAVISGAAVSGALEQTSTEVAKVPGLAGDAGLRWWLDVLASYRKELFTLATYAVIAIYLLMNFLVLRAFRPRNNVGFREYFKLFCIASGFYLTAWTLADAFNVLVFGQDPSALSREIISSGAWPAVRDHGSSFPGLLVGATGLALLVHHTRVQASFWGLSALKVIVSVPLVFIAATAVVTLLFMAVLAAAGAAAWRPA